MEDLPPYQYHPSPKLQLRIIKISEICNQSRSMRPLLDGVVRVERNHVHLQQLNQPIVKDQVIVDVAATNKRRIEVL